MFGNNTDLASTVFVQNGQSIGVSGSWFSPGNASLVWDESLSLGTTSVDENGFFNANVQMPTTTSGQHRLSINDGIDSFCVNLTRLPTVSNDYVDGWHSQDITVNLTSDYPMNETFYRINGGSVYNLTSNGHPIITIESNNNTLEYWSTWNVYGTTLNELPHTTVAGIKLDKTAPTGSLTVETTYFSNHYNYSDFISESMKSLELHKCVFPMITPLGLIGSLINQLKHGLF